MLALTAKSATYLILSLFTSGMDFRTSAQCPIYFKHLILGTMSALVFVSLSFDFI